MRIRASVHYDWLQLIEVSGPFLSTTVLNEAFPDGLDGLDKHVKRDLSRFYSEWVEACEIHHPKLPELHSAWIQSVLRDGLEFRDGDLSAGAEWSVAGEGGLGKFSPDYALKGMDSKPVMFIKVLPVSVKPEDRDTSDDWKDSVIEKMTRLCRAYEVRIGLVTNGEKWVVVNAATGGTLSGTATWYARLWFQEDSTLRAFLALLGYRRFVGAPKKRLPYLLDESLKHLEEVTDTLGKQVMTAVEVLMEGFDRADLDSGRTLLAGVSPATLYESALTVMMRLVFLLCAEERGLMLLGEKTYDDVYAVSTLRKKLEEESDKFGPQVLERRYDAWARLLGVFRFVYYGVSHQGLRFPAMGGSLFDPEKYPFLEGDPPPLPIDNRTVLLILESLQVLKHKDGAIPLSFRSLDVEQIGYIYEGLLEFTGARADDLLLGLKGDKNHQNPEISLAELESLRMDSEEKLIKYVADKTGRTAIAKEYATEPNLEYLPYLSKICRGDKSLEERILPFLNWLRTSEWGEPVVYHKGSFYVTEGRERRSSGTHYTPKPLTEMIVKEALEPVVYDGPANGTPRAEWKLKSPDELLNLKVCDPAMGSGAFLVQVCRYLGDRLVDAWEIAEKAGKAIDRYGVVTESPPKEPMSKVMDDRLCIARQLVAEKCLYGVDINPLAVELAKLSIWLVTISKDRPFGFLDHNLKSGDSLLGISNIDQLVQFRMKPSARGVGNLMEPSIRQMVAEAVAEREAIRNAHVRDINDIRLQIQHNKNVENITRHLKDYADYFIGQVFTLGKPSRKTDAMLDSASMTSSILLNPEIDAHTASSLKKDSIVNLSYDLPEGQTSARRPFHWAIEFPEVFAQGGFDAIVGNPPFSGGRKLKESLGENCHSYIAQYVSLDGNGAKNADLCAYFFLRAFSLTRPNGFFGLIASNSIAEGDTRQTGVEKLLLNGAVIISAHPNMQWPGVAAVYISPMIVYKAAINSSWRGRAKINGDQVDAISSFLSDQTEWSLQRLVCNDDQSYQGTLVRGKGFIISKDLAADLIANDIRNKQVLLPYVTGEDVNQSVNQEGKRYVINFYDWPLSRAIDVSWAGLSTAEKTRQIKSGCVSKDYPFPVASDYPLVLAHLKQGVLSDNPNALDDAERPLWWQFWCPRSELYHLVGRGKNFALHPEWWKGDAQSKRVCILTRVSKTLAFVNVSNGSIFADTTIVFTRRDRSTFAVLSSCFHSVFAWKYSSRMKTDLRYAPNDCYKTFPFPLAPLPQLGLLGEQFDEHRRKIMQARQIGLTTLYNLFHDSAEKDAELEEMRRLQREIDIAVRDSYGWQDIDLEHGFHQVGYLPANDNIRYTISEPARIEILKRLSALNRQRWEEEEAAGLHKKGKT